MTRMFRLILNGKKADQPEIRDAVSHFRKQGADISVRVTWEGADMPRLVDEAINDGVVRLMIGGGDGTLNDAVCGLLSSSLHKRTAKKLPELAILPLGTANDFAKACQIPTSVFDAIELAINGQAADIDVIKVNDRFCLNVATAGFGAQVTAETPVELKNFLGGGAYTLTGLAKALGFEPYKGKITSELGIHEGEIIVGALCNGRQAGGGQVLAPNAYINDGLMDVTLLRGFSALALPQVIDEMQNLSADAEFFYHFQTDWLEFEFANKLPLNLDGEPYPSEKVRFDVIANAISLVLPQKCCCLSD